MIGRSILALTGAALLLPAAAQAQSAPGIAEFAANLAYDYCPKLLEGDLAIDSAEIKRLGFAEAPSKHTHPRVGDILLVGTKRADGEVTLAVNPDGGFCQVNVLGANAVVAQTRLRASLSRLGQKFEPDPANSLERGGATVETLKSVLGEGMVLRVQFVRATSSPTPMTGFQMVVMDQ